jgi:hypothetical protein
MSTHVKSGGRYPVLRSLAILQVLVALVMAVAGVAGSIYAAWGGQSTWGADFGIVGKLNILLVGLASTFFMVVFTLAFAELIKLLIDIEHNTRVSAIGAPSNGQTTVTTTAGTDGGRVNRIAAIEDEETAEAALIRGH